LAERQPSKLNVAGSIPVSRSTLSVLLGYRAVPRCCERSLVGLRTRRPGVPFRRIAAKSAALDRSVSARRHACPCDAAGGADPRTRCRRARPGDVPRVGAKNPEESRTPDARLGAVPSENIVAAVSTTTFACSRTRHRGRAGTPAGRSAGALAGGSVRRGPRASADAGRAGAVGFRRAAAGTGRRNGAADWSRGRSARGFVEVNRPSDVALLVRLADAPAILPAG
jgi:hypothetical protein